MTDNLQGDDKLLTCVDCGAQFAFSSRDQAFYQQRGFQPPRRCRTCRDKRKSAAHVTPAHAAAQPGAPAPQAFSTPPAPAAAAGPGAVPAGGQFKVTCSSCGLETTVPFKPDPNRPVYCRTCYLNRRKQGQK